MFKLIINREEGSGQPTIISKLDNSAIATSRRSNLVLLDLVDPAISKLSVVSKDKTNDVQNKLARRSNTKFCSTHSL